jgi:anti-sigma factor RsiW
MSTREAQYSKIPQYVQNQLAGEELEEFEAHLVTCPACTAELQQERALSALLRRSSPLYEAPAECAERVRELLAEHRTERPAMPAAPSREALAKHRRLLRLPLLIKRWRAQRARMRAAIQQRNSPALWVARLTPHPFCASFSRVLVPAVVVIALCLLILPSLVRQARADSYVNTAVTSYHQVLEGRLSFGIQSNSPNEVTAWISGRVPFRFRLPAPGNAEQDQPAYRLAGASLIKIKDHPAALITYTKQGEKITLLVASDQYATVTGGNRIRHQDLTFHYFTVNGARVVTWRNHGLSYALVTSNSSSEQGLRPCLVCHQDMTDHRFFQVPHKQ